MAEVAVYTVSGNTLDLHVTQTTKLCKLCLMDLPITDMYTMWHCHCHFCNMCMQQYVSVMVSEGRVLSLSCPDGDCANQTPLDNREVELLVDSRTFARYRRIKFLREVERDPGKAFCPQVGCETVCDVGTVNSKHASPPSPITCPSCQYLFCCVCKEHWHGELSCDEAILTSGRAQDAGIPFVSEEDSDIKRCPLCHVPIERNDGCAQMMCKQCHHFFCWYCLASLDDDFLLRHYDKGPCKNKLGHSRASVIWHRTQVVGIFAGFSILLLVASPFLLLAAPCLLCCKCKACKNCEEELDINDITSS